MLIILRAFIRAELSFLWSWHKPPGRSWMSELIVRTLRILTTNASEKSLASIRKAMSVPATSKQKALCDVESSQIANIDCLILHPRAGQKENHHNEPDTVLIYLHGGAYIAGSPQGFYGFVAELVTRIGGIAIVPDYSLAPEHPFPRAIDDCLAVIHDAHQTYPTANIVLSGDSAGGGLALACAMDQQVQNTKLIHRLALISPWVNPNQRAGSMQSNAQSDFLVQSLLDYGFESYAGENKHDPRVEFSNLNGEQLPPTYIQYGGAEMFCDQITDFCESAGGNIRCDCYQGQPHDFQIVLGHTKIAKRAIDSMARFLSS